VKKTILILLLCSLVPLVFADLQTTASIICENNNLTYTQCVEFIDAISSQDVRNITTNITYTQKLSDDEIEDIRDDILEDIESDYYDKDELETYVDDILEDSDINFKKYELDKQVQLELARIDANKSTNNPPVSIYDEMEQALQAEIERERMKMQYCMLYPDLAFCNDQITESNPDDVSDKIIELQDQLNIAKSDLNDANDRADRIANNSSNNNSSPDYFMYLVFAGAGGIGYFFWKNHQEKEEKDKLNKETQAMDEITRKIKEKELEKLRSQNKPKQNEETNKISEGL
jgi:hypothetical protein